MSVMSAAEAGQAPGTGQEILPRGPRMAVPAADQDGIGPESSSADERSAEAGHATAARGGRRLRLVTTEVHVTEVRVAREVSTRTVRAGGPGPGGQGADGPGVSAQRVREPRGMAQRVSAERASVQRTCVQRVAAPGVRAGRVSVQRASAQRVSVRGASVRPGLRLTRRGRRVLTGFVMLVVVVSAMLIWTGVAGGAQAPGPGAPVRSPYQGMTQIVVQPGQTLWSIAAAVDPSADPWTAVQQISDANALNDARIQAGQLLWVPRG